MCLYVFSFLEFAYQISSHLCLVEQLVANPVTLPIAVMEVLPASAPDTTPSAPSMALTETVASKPTSGEASHKPSEVYMETQVELLLSPTIHKLDASLAVPPIVPDASSIPTLVPYSEDEGSVGDGMHVNVSPGKHFYHYSKSALETLIVTLIMWLPCHKLYEWVWSQAPHLMVFWLFG